MDPSKMTHLNFKPLNILPCRDFKRFGGILDIGGTYTLYATLMKPPKGLEAARNFSIKDVVVGETVLGGTTTSGAWDFGVVTGWSTGKYFTFDGLNAGSLLWGNLLLLRGKIAEEARTRYKDSVALTISEPDVLRRPVLLKRTDSLSHCEVGYPDVDFWARSGERAWYEVSPTERAGLPRVSSGDLSARIDELKRLILGNDGSLLLSEVTAIKNQIADLTVLEAQISTPPRAVSPVGFRV